MTTDFFADAPHPPTENRCRVRPARDVSINDYLWLVRPQIFSETFILHSTPAMKGVQNHGLCRTVNS
jgi:hypothetical protein